VNAKPDGSPLSRQNLGFLLARASKHWNERLYERFAAAGFPEVRPAYGSLLVPLYEEDGLRQGELARRARLSKQTLTTMTRALEQAGLIERRRDPDDGRATRLYLTSRANDFRPVAERALADLDRLAGQSVRTGLPALRRALETLGDL
jgi:MarR family transcriptional regulator, organic hydroperoxide resistance regulator